MSEETTIYDVIIIGAGPAGLSAAIYASRRAMKTLVLSSDIGGQAAKTLDIENYPGVDKISGIELSNKFREQAERFGSTIIIDEAKEITPQDGIFKVKTSTGEFTTKSIILAYGKKPRELGIPGEQEFKGRGVTYCATCDAPFFKNRDVIIVGGGNSALDAAILTSKIANKVYLVHRGPEFRGEQYLIDKVKEAENIEILFNEELVEIKGEGVVKSATLKSEKEITANGVMVEVGYIVDRSLTTGLVDHDERNQVIVDELQKTSVPGIFAAGDVTPTPYKQVVISASEGAKAALSAFDYLQRLQGKRGVVADWH